MLFQLQNITENPVYCCTATENSVHNYSAPQLNLYHSAPIILLEQNHDRRVAYRQAGRLTISTAEHTATRLQIHHT